MIVSSRKTERAAINKLAGRKTRQATLTEVRKPVIDAVPAPYPIRRKPLGQSSGSQEGVAGWRSGFHRPDGVKLDGSDFSGSYLAYLRGGRV